MQPENYARVLDNRLL